MALFKRLLNVLKKAIKTVLSGIILFVLGHKKIKRIIKLLLKPFPSLRTFCKRLQQRVGGPKAMEKITNGMHCYIEANNIKAGASRACDLEIILEFILGKGN